MNTLAQLLLYRDAELLWARRDNRWDVYPDTQPTELAVHNYEGWWLPSHDSPGMWYKSPCSYVTASDASAPALFGARRRRDRITAGRDLRCTAALGASPCVAAAP
jgi:hypothetical protein